MAVNNQKSFLLFLASVLFFLQCSFVLISAAKKDENSEGKCVMFDSCGEDPDLAGKCLNCHYDGAPLKLKDNNAYEKLYEACPHFK